jgi:CSLREA domain-containing protein
MGGLRHVRVGATRTSSLVLAILLVTSALAIAPVPVAQAATLTVTTVADELNNDGDCSLREAVRAANLDAAVDACAAGSGADVILLPRGNYRLTRLGFGEDAAATGDLDIMADLAIRGAGADVSVIDGVALDRVVHVMDDVNAAIARVTIRNGVGGPDFGQGGIYEGAGIANYGTLVVADSVVRDNRAPSVCFGITCVAPRGGGIFNDGGTLTLVRSTVSNNVAAFGGGIANAVGVVTVQNSTVSGNTGEASGGGFTNAGTIVLENSTVSFNHADISGGGVQNAGTLETENTILAGNTRNPVVGTGGPDCNGQLQSRGYNLIGDTTGCAIGGTTTGDLSGVDPLLGPLQNNGGETPTRALLPDSPAIDAGNPGSGATACFPTDQRGVARPQDGDGDGQLRCDMGAFEASLPALEVPVDIRPRRCPNGLLTTDRRALPVTLSSTDTFDVRGVDPASLRLEGVAPLAGTTYRDVVTSFLPPTGKDEATDCTDAGPDAFLDLTVSFSNQAVVAALGPVSNGEVRVLRVRGNLRPSWGGTPFVGEDVVVIVAP